MNRGHGLGREDLTQHLQTFWEMSKKTIVEFSRYPIAFVAMFAQIFLIILMFLFAAIAFTDPLTEMEVTLPATTEGAATLDWLNQTTTVLGVDYGSFTVVHLRAEPAVVQSIQARSLEARELNAGLGQQIAGVMIYGFVTNMFLSFTLWEIGFSIREEQARGTLESLYLSPASKFGSLLSRIFAITIFTGIMCAAGVLMVNYLVGGLAFQNAGFALLVLLLSFSGFLGFGFVFAGISIKLKESAQFLVNGTQFFFMIFSAQFFPFGALRSLHPGIVDYVSRWLPVSYSVDLFRSSLLGFPAGYPELADPATEFVIVLLFGILSPLVGYVVYRYVERKARKDGNLGEF